jgi:hypothetical protein
LAKTKASRAMRLHAGAEPVEEEAE